MINGNDGMDLKATSAESPETQARRDATPIRHVAIPLIKLMSCIFRLKDGSTVPVILAKPSSVGNIHIFHIPH
jgi:hypothetical protein